MHWNVIEHYDKPMFNFYFAHIKVYQSSKVQTFKVKAGIRRPDLAFGSETGSNRSSNLQNRTVAHYSAGMRCSGARAEEPLKLRIFNFLF